MCTALLAQAVLWLLVWQHPVVIHHHGHVEVGFLTAGYTRLSAKCIDETGGGDNAAMVAHATTHV